MAAMIGPERVLTPQSLTALPRLRARTISVVDLSPWDLAQWRHLARRSCHQTPFLLPEFLLPAWKYLVPHQRHELALVEDVDTGRWLAAGCFRRGHTDRPFPVPHAVATHTDYTFLTGLLLDAECAPSVLDLFLQHLTQSSWFDHGVAFPGLRLDSRLAGELQAASTRLGFEWRTHRERLVPVIFPDLVSDAYFDEHWSKSRRKTLRRCRSRLEELGPVQLRLARHPDDVSDALEQFLRLERDSWKGEEGTACLSHPRHAAWIREAVMGLALHGNVVISSLMAGKRVAAVAINLVSGTNLFAFKIGWDGALAEASPGVLHEVELAREATGRLREFTLLDSCATEASYIAPLWPERIPVGTGMVCASQLAKWSQTALDTARTVKNLIRKPQPQS